jgi:hypothetical protein
MSAAESGAAESRSEATSTREAIMVLRAGPKQDWCDGVKRAAVAGMGDEKLAARVSIMRPSVLTLATALKSANPW